MPELPEVETVCRTIYPHVHNCVFNSCTLLRKQTLHEQSLNLDLLAGLSVGNVRRRGKLIIFDLSGGSTSAPQYLIFHLRMTGRLFTRAANSLAGRHTRCLFELQKPDASNFQLYFDDTRTFGQIFAANDKLLSDWKFWTQMGPEPLEVSADCFALRLKGSKPIKTALLDQSVIAGIGNIYADESLFAAGINPLKPAGSLSQTEKTILLKSLQDTLNNSIAQCGSSIRDYRDADGNSGAFQNSFLVYGRGGKQCKQCGTLLEKTRLGGRATVYCPHCQPC